MDFGMSQSDMESIQGGLDPSGATGGTTSDFSTGDPSLGDNDYTVTGTPTQFRTVQNYTQARGATTTNPFPESFFSQLFGADNVNYTNILGSDRINEINDLRYNQAIGGMSNRTGENTGKPYQMGDYYIGQPTQMGTVKEVPQTGIMSLVDNLPYIGTISNIMGRNRGLPEGSKEYKDLMAEQVKSANEPSYIDRGVDYIKDLVGLGQRESLSDRTKELMSQGKVYSEQDILNEPNKRIDALKEFYGSQDTTGPSGIQNVLSTQEIKKGLDDAMTFAGDALSKDGVPILGNEDFRFNVNAQPNRDPNTMLNFKYSF
jgi:hypothetical protein